MKSIIEKIKLFALLAAIAAVPASLAVLSWKSYHHRFPDAPFWTWLFK